MDSVAFTVSIRRDGLFQHPAKGESPRPDAAANVPFRIATALEARYRASLDLEVVANPPFVRPQELRDPRMLDLTFDPRLGAFTTPTLVLWGVQDRVNPAGGGPSLQEQMRNCALYLFSRTGHCVQWERAAAFNAAAIANLSQA